MGFGFSFADSKIDASFNRVQEVRPSPFPLDKTGQIMTQQIHIKHQSSKCESTQEVHYKTKGKFQSKLSNASKPFKIQVDAPGAVSPSNIYYTYFHHLSISLINLDKKIPYVGSKKLKVVIMTKICIHFHAASLAICEICIYNVSFGSLV